MNTAERIKRTVVAGTIVGATAFGSACSEAQKIELPVPTPLSSIAHELQKQNQSQEYAAWALLHPYERIQRLETRVYPKVEGFNPQEELRKASAQNFLYTTGAQLKTEELLEKVRILSREQFVQTLIEQGEPPVSRQRLESDLNQKPEIKTKEGNILLNEFLLNKAGELVRSSRPDIQPATKEINIDIMVKKSALYRAYAELLTPKDEEKLSINIPFPNESNPITVTERKGLVFTGVRKNGISRVLDGAEKAHVELVARLIDPTNYLSINVIHSQAADKILEINRLAGISREEYLHAFAKKGFVQYIVSKWPTPNNPDITTKQDASYMLVAFALSVEQASQLRGR